MKLQKDYWNKGMRHGRGRYRMQHRRERWNSQEDGQGSPKSDTSKAGPESTSPLWFKGTESSRRCESKQTFNMDVWPSTSIPIPFLGMYGHWAAKGWTVFGICCFGVGFFWCSEHPYPHLLGLLLLQQLMDPLCICHFCPSDKHTFVFGGTCFFFCLPTFQSLLFC